jgi:hypothetical protein
MIPYYGDFAEDSTVYIPFNTFSSNDPSASVTVTDLADADIKVHKDGGTTQIVTDGATVAIDYDSITGNHLITVDTSAHADYSTGSEYAVRLEGITVDGATLNVWVGAFSIERAGGALALLKGATGLVAIDTVVDAIKVVTDKFTFTVANQVDANTLSVGGTTQTAGDVGADTAAILADTNELQTDDIPGTLATIAAYIDTEVAAILVDTGTTLPALIGTPAGADIAADIAAVKVDTAATLVDTAEIGVAGAGLTDLGGMSTGMKAEVNAEADTALTDYDGPTNAEMEARTPTAAQLAYIVANAATGLPVTFTTAGGSTTAAVLNQVDGAAASAVDDQYNGRLLVFIDGTLKGVVTDITDYDGGTTTATITAIPTAPTSSHNARLI